MQNRRNRNILCGILAGSLLGAGGFAVPTQALGIAVLSPGLDCLSSACDMIQTGLISTEISFTREDFADAIGYTPDSVTITSLPPASEGTLYFGTLPVTVNQKITGANLPLLRFVPAEGCTSSSFRFRGDHTYSHSCTLRFTQTVNQSPVTDSSEAVQVWTQQNIGTWGNLPGSDPEGDSLQFEIVSYPMKGLITLTNPASGAYRYTPYENAVGSDVFSYQIRDSYGNYSPVRTMEVSIEEAACDIVFADMSDHWAQNAAVVMVADNAMEVFSEGGEIWFRPDDAISREDYLVTVMKALGAGEAEPCSTVFADENKMDPASTGYIHRAYTLGIIRGTEADGTLLFRPDDSITRAEAAVILNAIIGADTPDVLPTFADTSAIPAWASPSLYALNSLGILKGTGDGLLSPDTTLSRAQTAQMLLAVKNLLKE
ncbi:MAG: S-layer homology domain-containing protein [Clostridia bacterium]|nr:S-layer homology domain-containing protein [Clostridia bacterium]